MSHELLLIVGSLQKPRTSVIEKFIENWNTDFISGTTESQTSNLSSPEQSTYTFLTYQSPIYLAYVECFRRPEHPGKVPAGNKSLQTFVSEPFHKNNSSKQFLRKKTYLKEKFILYIVFLSSNHLGSNSDHTTNSKEVFSQKFPLLSFFTWLAICLQK